MMHEHLDEPTRDGNEEWRKPILAQRNGEDTPLDPPFGGVAGDRKLSRGQALRLLGGSFAGAALLSTGLARTAGASTPTPSDPGSLYVLDWESLAQRSAPGSPPPGWAAHYDPDVVHADGKPQLRAYRDAALVPVRSGTYSARFALERGDPVIHNGARCELAAAGVEPVGAERWYGFSIYLPGAWVSDQAAEIVTQWHHDLPGGSPPLAIVTRRGQWEVSQNWEGPFYSNVRVGSYQTSRWTDWVVHVKWSAGSAGRLTIWKDGQKVTGWDPDRNKEVSFDEKPGKNTYSGVGNYMKIGIYKWAWSQGKPSDTTKRHMYYDALRIADGRGSYGAVAPG